MEVVLGVGVAGRGHLREVDHGDALLVVDHEVELVEVAVHQPVLGQLDDQAHEHIVDFLGMRDGAHLGHGVGLHEGHADAVAVGVNGHGRGEAAFVERLHESELLQGGQSTEVEPGVAVSALLEVVAIGLDAPKRGAAEPGELYDDGGAFGVVGGADVDVGLLADADLEADLLDEPALHKHSERQVVVAHEGERVPAVVLARVEDQLVLEEEGEDLEGLRALEAAAALDELVGDELVVLHAHLDGRQHSEMVLVEVVD
mmetsp:Transcript_11179/g.18796  ORF Transcript_11179/g.18796 Transcript_11179/m.18796 type:complete len:258 (+) Transcript_11179:811-1584(+)